MLTYSDPVSVRAVPDACPGVFAPHDAADGALARIRVPGGVITSVQLHAVADLAAELGDGHVHLTSRGNLQLRGLDRTDPSAAQRLTAAGLLPSRTHERVRNIQATPLSGLAEVARELDWQLCARPGLARLPGRFLFGLDDGRGDIVAQEPDVCWQTGRVLLAGRDAGLVDVDPVAALLAAAEAFLAVRSTQWRVQELGEAERSVMVRVLRERDLPASRRGGGSPAAPPPHVVVAPVLGELTAAQVHAMADAAPSAVVTPWRTVILVEPTHVPDGLPTDPEIARVSACAGRPGCAKALADVRADTRAALAAGRLPAGRVHVSGCARRCGAPRGEHIEFVAGEHYL